MAQSGRSSLRDYGGDGANVVFVPSLINPPDVFDLAPANSLLAWLAEQGVRPLLVDWGTPSPADRALSVAGHVERVLIPLIEQLPAPPILAGYCLGGTMAIAAAGLTSVNGLALLATPWRFGGFPQESRDFMRSLWKAAGPISDTLGLFPMEALQAGFWQMDRAKTVAKFERFGTYAPDDARADAFVRLEDWANEGPPLTHAAAMELLVGLFGEDRTGAGRWSVGGRIADPATLDCPILDIVSTSDRIVPAASAAAVGDRRLLTQGHVGMIVGGQARTALWEPLAAWLRGIGA